MEEVSNDVGSVPLSGLIFRRVVRDKRIKIFYHNFDMAALHMAMVNRAIFGPSRPGSHGTVALTPPKVRGAEDRDEIMALLRSCNSVRRHVDGTDFHKAMMSLDLFLEACRYLMVSPLQVLYSPYVTVYDPGINRNLTLNMSDLRKRWAHG